MGDGRPVPSLGGADEGDLPPPIDLTRHFVISRNSIPAIAAQPTTRGRRMSLSTGAAQPDGSVIPSWGDYLNNTGKIDVLAVSRQGQVVTAFAQMDTEEIIAVRRLADGRTYIPSVDPRSNIDGSLVTTAPSGAFGSVTIHVSGHNPYHVFDVTRDGSSLLVCGSREGDPTYGTSFVWSSADEGLTWAEELSGPPGWFDQFYRMNGRPTVNLSSQTFTRTTDGTWAAQSMLMPDQRPTPFATVVGTRVITSDRGEIGSVPSGDWTASLCDDAAIWLCDGTSLYLLPPP